MATTERVNIKTRHLNQRAWWSEEWH